MKTIKDFELKSKKVIIRVDFNVPIKNGIIEDDKRIVASLETINYAIDNDAKVILMSHLGRVKKEEDKVSLKPVSDCLSKLLNKNIIFIPFTRGKEVEEAINGMKEKDIILLENTRYEDLNNKAESTNNEELGKYWASLGDIFINDAFGTIHRAHASNVGIASNLNSGVGFLVLKEISMMQEALDDPERPLTVILGGAKVVDKIGLIDNLILKADYLLIGGAMAFTFLKASGIEVGNSFIDLESIDFCKQILKKNKDKIILPIDVITDTKRECFINEIKKSEQGFDIGPKTIKLFNLYLNSSKTIILNGPMGKFEEKGFENGTVNLFKILKSIDAIKIAGGGDTASSIKKFNSVDSFTHISTGGGATLELLEGKTLPGLEIIK